MAAPSSTSFTTVEDDHLNFVRAGVPSVDVIDLDNPTWHTAQDDIEHVSQKSLQIVGDVILAALPDIEKRAACSTDRWWVGSGRPGGESPYPTSLDLAESRGIRTAPVRSHLAVAV